MIMKKNELSDVLRILLYTHKLTAIRKKLVFGTRSLLMTLRKNARRGFKTLNVNSSQKNVLHYITSRNMRKTITPSYLNETNVSNQHQDKMKTSHMKEIINFISYNWQQSKNVFCLSNYTANLNFHSSPSNLGNLIIKQGTKTPVEDEESWGGPEAFKLIVFLKEDFDATIKKYPSIIVLFYAYWCPHCLRLKKPFGNAAVLSKDADLDMAFGAFDVTGNPDIADQKGVVGIPVMKYYSNGKYISTYSGKRTSDDLYQFARNPPKAPLPSELKRPDV